MELLEPATYKLIESLAGDIKPDDLHYVESFVTKEIAVFLPVGGYCGYSITENHTHPGAMFTIHFDNLGLMSLNSQLYRSKPDTTFYLPPMIPHHEIADQRPSRFIAMFISENLLQEICNEYGLPGDQLQAPRLFQTPHTLLDTIKLFMEETRSNYPGQKRVLEGITLRIIHILVRTLCNIETEKSINPELITENFRINRVLNYIHENLAEKITIEQLASIAHLSPSHFAQIFRRETKETPHRYLLLTRLLHSQKLILEGKLNLTEIAYQCGFSSSSHFTTAFQKEFSLSPSDFKKRGL